MAEFPGSSMPPTRRTVVAAAGGAGLAAVLTACGSDSDSGSAADAPASGAPSSGAASDAGTPSASDGSGGSGGSGGGTPLGKTSDIPVGGGKVFADQKVVVTQPTAGTFKGFSAVCTHQGCVVADVSGGTINCHCHGSKFNAADGSVAHGPATSPLPSQAVAVSGDSVTMG
ncbi:Rieske (2Fe-2S) protein [Actinacidiphila bryophytorum]|uniref:Cytochrome bc1 complex Rieske iron-sulfur subunit n=1 Tax=Actinacidiphila bryophytorum TaxID=1436133 RepID=A0A9W4E908_9ACTN|nr:Rieske (2Fe-2S) protein [Actinacidiphila bryophytorum]MBM9439125.1 Rieske (2Fe-2S) protein [Actinacidiphila bryophytorum]MBN6544280.1 Rieske (2Fe-2S) protein [Actinacidiphila bryophytorum]CAG7622115.1 Ferredoxin subunit of nitrite reductase or a ring-hydroxylating dioxygenase [Actinacidiphila bryophytorum]